MNATSEKDRRKVITLWTAASVAVILAASLLVIQVNSTGGGAYGATAAPTQTAPAPEAQSRQAKEAQRIAPTCGDVCYSKSRRAGRKFRNRRIDRSNGLRPAQLFASPRVAKRVYTRKFKRLIHRRFHRSSVSARVAERREVAMSGYCTSDTLACARTWYERTLERRCVAEGNPFPSDSNACTEPARLPSSRRYTKRNIIVTGSVFLCGGETGIAIGTATGTAGLSWATFSGPITACWASVWAIDSQY